MTKFDETFIIDTRVDVPHANALVKRVHMMPLKTRFKPKKITRTVASKSVAEAGMRRKEESDVAILVVKSDVVLINCQL